jgi:hypothetical protein
VHVEAKAPPPPALPADPPRAPTSSDANTRPLQSAAPQTTAPAKPAAAAPQKPLEADALAARLLAAGANSKDIATLMNALKPPPPADEDEA